MLMIRAGLSEDEVDHVLDRQREGLGAGATRVDQSPTRETTS
jgi:hypothetical protein